MNIWKHFCTINHHKILVMRGCFQVGLIRQGLLHDLSKYSPTEFIVGCKYYQGNMSPNNAEREAVGYSSAWLHHKGRNKHHLEYWIDYGIPDKEGPHKGEHKGLCGGIEELPERKVPGRQCFSILYERTAISCAP